MTLDAELRSRAARVGDDPELRRRYEAWQQSLTDSERAVLAQVFLADEDQYFPSARPKQQPPPGDWQIWVILAGRGYGKTRCGAEWIVQQADDHVGEFVVLAETFAKGRDICFEGLGDNGGPAGILSVLRRRGRDDEAATWNRSLGECHLRNGSMLKLLTGEKPDAPRGWNLAGAWADEFAAWRYPQTFDQLLLALRMGERPRVLVTTTPKPTVAVRDLVERERSGDPAIVITRGSTQENAENLSQFALAELERRYGGTRLGRQELEGELLEDVEGACGSERGSTWRACGICRATVW